MGCLLEFIFEIFFEGILELIGYCYIKLMTLIVPEKAVSNKTKTKIKNIITTISALLGVVLIIGVILLLPPDPFINKIGRFMTFIPLSIIVIQIVLGIIMKIINKFQKSDESTIP